MLLAAIEEKVVMFSRHRLSAQRSEIVHLIELMEAG